VPAPSTAPAGGSLQPGLSPHATRFTYENVSVGGVMFGTPMYGGLAHDAFVQGMIDTTRLFAEKSIPLNYCFLRNESLIQRARNYIVAQFLASSCTHLFFIDADIGFDAACVLRILAHDRPIMAGLYRKKTLEEVAFAMNIQPRPDGTTERDPRTGAIRVGHAATGFLCIKREVLEVMHRNRPELHYKPYPTEGKPGPWREKTFLAFDCFIDDAGHYLSEDYGFAVRAAECGFASWVDPGIVLEHHGAACFVADPMEALGLAEMAAAP
jgi:hypothetical protein